MLDREDRSAIEGLFERIANVARSSGPRDEEAEDLIRQRIREAPESTYYMAQTLLMQEHALRAAEQRIAELEEGAGTSGVGASGRGVFEGDRQAGMRNPPSCAPRGPWGPRENHDRADEDRYGGRRGGGFLAGAAQTALGVTGGVLLGSAIAGMLTGGAHADEHPDEQPADEPAEDFDTGMDDGGDFDVGGDF